MGNIFSGSEIVGIGVQIEKNGRDFYNTLALGSKIEKDRDMFKFLAGEEEKHIVVFQGILNQTAEYVPLESYPGEYFEYMNALAGEYVFTQKDKGVEIAKSILSDAEAIELGIGFEKDSIIFYEGMKKVIPGYDFVIINQLIEQEQNHLKMLTELKHSI